MSIDRGLVEHVAWLARLALSEEEKRALVEDLNQILGHIQKLKEFHVEGVPPTFHVLTEKSSIMRPDEVQPCLDRGDVLANTSKVAEGQFRVARIIGADSREEAGS